jgi:hypothetical protein
MTKAERDEAFEQYHRDNPQVYSELTRLARQLKGRGRRHYGIASLFEVLRWHHALHTVGDEFKINNNYKPRYARMVMDNEPDLAGFFMIRELAA